MEVAFDKETDLVHVRDSKDRSGSVLTFERATFQDFIAFIRESDPLEQ